MSNDNNNNNNNNNSNNLSTSTPIIQNMNTMDPAEQIQFAVLEQYPEVYITRNNGRNHFSDIITPTRLPFKAHEEVPNTTSTDQQDPNDNHYYLARDSNVSRNSMPQFPCAAKSRTSIRNLQYYYHQDYYHNSTLPRSPRIPSSLSDIIQFNTIDTNNSRQLQNPDSYYQDRFSITEIPLNTGDDDSINDEKQERRQVLQGASSSKTLVAMPMHPSEQQYSTTDPSTNDTNKTDQQSQHHNNRQSWRVTATESIFSMLSAPSKISRSTTQHYVFSPPSLAELRQHHQSFNNYGGSSKHQDEEETVTMYMDDEKTLDSKGNKRRPHLKKPSQRGLCNTMTIATVVVVVLFLFAGYPLSVHIAKQRNENNHTPSSSLF
ncbi:hypothetical protein BDA99DRAFT_553856 [Phascolomyces articulosus]|uniref:Uncharacterized protein n=1 Tax=Phascolomyces articulosus TaxID=60185 RepID=A0AAD5PJ05_9FUNG|nr:hypothetical protein BDA99DRAFT_553856 [Phascolomyces articulosus]